MEEKPIHMEYSRGKEDKVVFKLKASSSDTNRKADESSDCDTTDDECAIIHENIKVKDFIARWQLVRQHHVFETPIWNEIFGEEHKIGRIRRDGVEIVCPSFFISHYHCVIKFEKSSNAHGGIWTIEDLESTNGTYLNAELMPKGTKSELKENDLILLGKSSTQKIAPADERLYSFKFVRLCDKENNVKNPKENENTTHKMDEPKPSLPAMKPTPLLPPPPPKQLDWNKGKSLKPCPLSRRPNPKPSNLNNSDDTASTSNILHNKNAVKKENKIPPNWASDLSNRQSLDIERNCEKKPSSESNDNNQLGKERPIDGGKEYPCSSIKSSNDFNKLKSPSCSHCSSTSEDIELELNKIRNEKQKNINEEKARSIEPENDARESDRDSRKIRENQNKEAEKLKLANEEIERLKSALEEKNRDDERKERIKEDEKKRKQKVEQKIKKKAEEEKRKVDEDKKKVREEKRKLDEDKKKIEEDKKSVEEALKTLKSVEEEKKKSKNEKQMAAEIKKKEEERKMVEDQKTVQNERKSNNKSKRRHSSDSSSSASSFHEDSVTSSDTSISDGDDSSDRMSNFIAKDDEDEYESNLIGETRSISAHLRALEKNTKVSAAVSVAKRRKNKENKAAKTNNILKMIEEQHKLNQRKETKKRPTISSSSDSSSSEDEHPTSPKRPRMRRASSLTNKSSNESDDKLEKIRKNQERLNQNAIKREERIKALQLKWIRENPKFDASKQHKTLPPPFNRKPFIKVENVMPINREGNLSISIRVTKWFTKKFKSTPDFKAFRRNSKDLYEKKREEEEEERDRAHARENERAREEEEEKKKEFARKVREKLEEDKKKKELARKERAKEEDNKKKELAKKNERAKKEEEERKKSARKHTQRDKQASKKTDDGEKLSSKKKKHDEINTDSQSDESFEDIDEFEKELEERDNELTKLASQSPNSFRLSPRKVPAMPSSLSSNRRLDNVKDKLKAKQTDTTKAQTKTTEYVHQEKGRRGQPVKIPESRPPAPAVPTTASSVQPQSKWQSKNPEMRKKLMEIKKKELSSNSTARDQPEAKKPRLDHIPAPVNSKVTHRSRNDQFLNDMLRDAPISPEAPQQNIPKKVVAPERAVRMSKEVETPPAPPTAPAASAVREKPSTTVGIGIGQAILNKMENAPRLSQITEGAKRTARLPSSTPSEIDRNVAKKNALMLKPGVQLAKSVEQTHAKVPSDGQNTNWQNTSHAGKYRFDEATPYRDVFAWNTNWLNEQDKQKAAPPLTKKYTVRTLLAHYNTFEHYIQVFCPLMLHELWSSLFNDFQSDGHKSGKVKFDVQIQKIDTSQICPLVSQQLKRVGNVSIIMCEDEKWQVIKVSATCSTRNELDSVRDLAILTVTLTGKDKDGQQQKKEQFCYIRNEDIQPISGQGVSRRFKANFTLTTQFSKRFDTDKIDQTKPATLNKVAYIGSYFREFKSIAFLRDSHLFQKILYPSLDEKPFDPASPPPPPTLFVRNAFEMLNSLQRSIVYYISEKATAGKDPELFLLHGPPGTGKTRTIVGLILQLLLKNDKSKEVKKILVCTPSNTAIDELITRLHYALLHYEGKEKPLMVRIGGDHKVEDKDIVREYQWDKIARNAISSVSIQGSYSSTIEFEKSEVAALEEQLKAFNKNTSSALIESTRRELAEKKKTLNKHIKEFEQEQNSSQSKKRFDDEKIRILSKANIICGTLSSCSANVIARAIDKVKNKIDFCIIDEATQATEPASLAPLTLYVDKILLVGDPHQLPATVISNEAASKEFGQSLFARHFKYYSMDAEKRAKSPVMTLSLQYRMHPEILKWPNEYFYKSVLKTHDFARMSTPNDSSFRLMPYAFLNIPGKESTTLTSISNSLEVDLLIELLKTIVFQRKGLMDKNTPSLSIGIITPYNEQRRCILKAISDQKLDNSLPSIEVSTVDSFQGREKDIILLSCVRTGEMGFLKNPQRLNVALTRAKKSLIIIGDAKCLNADPMWKSLLDDATTRGTFKRIPDDYQERMVKDKNYLKKVVERSCLTPKRSNFSKEDRFHETLPKL